MTNVFVDSAVRACLCAALLTGTASPQQRRTYRTREATIRYNSSPKVARAVGKRIDNYCKAFESFYDAIRLEKKSDNKIVARVFNSYDEYADFHKRFWGDEDPPLAFFSRSMNQLVLYDDDEDVTLRQTLFHECSHQYLYRYNDEAPSWLHEGLAEYFEGFRVSREGKVLAKRPNIYDLVILQTALRTGEYLPPRELVAMSDDKFDDFRKNYPKLHSYLHYATAWGFVWYCLEIGQAERKLLVDYFHELGAKGERARFRIKDWEQFESKWKKAILELDPECSDAIDHVLLGSGYRSNGDYEKAIAQYLAALKKDPETPGVLYWLGYSYKRDGDYENALKWLTKAKDRYKTNPSPPYMMARIVLGVDMEGAPSDPSKALVLAKEALERAGRKSPKHLELVARCHAAAGDRRAAVKMLRRAIKYTEDDESRERYEKLAEEFRKRPAKK